MLKSFTSKVSFMVVVTSCRLLRKDIIINTKKGLKVRTATSPLVGRFAAEFCLRINDLARSFDPKTDP